MALISKVFSFLSQSWATGGTFRRCYSGICSPPPPLAVEELKNRHGFGPWLMFADAENDKIDPSPAGGGFRRCYSFASGEIFSLPAPHLQGRRCWGTQYGWLFTCSPSNGHVDLFNPLTHHKLPLPSCSRERQTSIFHGFSLSSDSDRLVVMTMSGGFNQLAFSSPGDEAWKYLDFSEPSLEDSDDNLHLVNFDTIFYRGQFYSIDCGGRLKAYDIISGNPQEKHIATFGASAEYGGLYLVEISGHLHLICGSYIQGADIREPDFWVPDGCPHNYTSKTKSFDIYRFDFQENKWISIEHLNGHTLFVGNNTTFAISAADYPEIKTDSIYFTDDNIDYYHRQFCDMGVYDFANKSLVEPVPFIKGDNMPYSNFSRPFFFLPSLSVL